MSVVIEGLVKAVVLIFTLNQDVLQITIRTLEVSGAAVLIAMLIGVPAGVALALSAFPGRRLVISLVNTGMGLPPVTVGLFVMILLWRSGPFGEAALLYSVWAMIVAQVIIAAPIVAGLTMSAIQSLDPRLRLQALSLGASPMRSIGTLMVEARLPALAAAIAGFGGIISEIGASMMTGGNIKGQTQILTTSIVQYSRMGQFDMAIALSLILLAMAFVVTYVLTRAQQQGGRGAWQPHSWR